MLKRFHETVNYMCVQNPVRPKGKTGNINSVERGNALRRSIPLQIAFIGMLVIGAGVPSLQAQDVDEAGQAATQQLRAVKAKFEQEMIDLEEIERHIKQLSAFYYTDPEGAFKARLPVSECTERAGPALCAALWPFYEDPSEAVLPVAALSTGNAGAGQ